MDAPQFSSRDDDRWFAQSLPAPVLTCVETFLAAFPSLTSERSVISRMIASIIELLPDEAKGKFISFTLPAVVSRAKADQIFSGLETLEILTNSAKTESLAVAAPLLLEALTDQSIYYIFGRLESIAVTAGEARSEVFNRSLPEMLKGKIEEVNAGDLFAFQQLCRTAREETPEVCNLLKRISDEQTWQLSLLRGMFIITSTSDMLSPKAAIDCLSFCSEVISIAKLSGGGDIGTLFKEAADLWAKWGEPKRRHIARELIPLLQEVQPNISLWSLISLISALKMDGDKAEALISNGKGIGAKLGAEGLLHYTTRVQNWAGRFDGEYLKPLAYYFAAAILADREVVAEAVISEFSRVFGYSRVGENLMQLADAVVRLDEQIPVRLATELTNLKARSDHFLQTDKAIRKSPVAYLLAIIHKSGDSLFNNWRTTEKQSFERWTALEEYYAEPAVRLPKHLNFVLPISPEGNQVALKMGKKLDLNFIYGRQRCFTTPFPYAQRLILQRLHEILGEDFRYVGLKEAHVALPLIVKASFKDEKVYKDIVRLSFPLLAAATGVELGSLEPRKKGIDVDQVYNFLESLRLLIDDRMPVTLSKYGMERKFIGQFKEIASLKMIQNELKKIERVKPRTIWRVDLTASKNAFDGFYDQLAETCIYEKCGSDLDSPFFQPVRLTSFEHQQIIGCLYLVKGNVLGEPALIMAGGGPKGWVVKAADMEAFVDGIKSCLKEVVLAEGYTALYAAVGRAADGKNWTDEGRVAQHPEVRALLIPENAAVIDLAEHEHIPFPRNYEYGPIRRVVKL